MLEQNTLAKFLDELDQTQQAFLDFLDQVNEDILYRRSSGEESWTLAESLAHITEARQFFSNQVRQALTTPGIQLGRTLDNPNRLQAVKEHGYDSVDALRQRFMASYESVTRILGGMTEQDLQTSCEHIRLGSITLAEFIQRAIVEHDRTHVEQARAFLADQ
jgi:uncharacterized damage-inducible protein DinB